MAAVHVYHYLSYSLHKSDEPFLERLFLIIYVPLKEILHNICYPFIMQCFHAQRKYWTLSNTLLH